MFTDYNQRFPENSSHWFCINECKLMFRIYGQHTLQPCMRAVFAFSLNFLQQLLFLSLSLSESPEGIGACVSSENGEL